MQIDFCKGNLISKGTRTYAHHVLIHGTWANRKDKELYSLDVADYKGGSTWNKSFSETLASAAGWKENETFEFTWTGENESQDRVVAGAMLAHRLMSDDNPNKANKHATLIGHSHGGNVIKIAKGILEENGWTVDVINMSTPQRIDFQQSKGKGVNLNFFSKGDLIQWIGTDDGLYMVKDLSNVGPLGSRKDPASYNVELDIDDNPVNFYNNKAGHSFHNDLEVQNDIETVVKEQFSKQ